MPQLTVILAASLLAGVLYGAASILLGGSVSIIGVLYGVQSTVVGWITHEFHSVVFGFVFAGFVSVAPDRYRDSFPAYVAIGVVWGVFLWLVAAGFISATWLRLLGTPVPIPNLTILSLVNHVVWGVSLGALTALGYRHVTPWLARRFDRIR